MDFGIEDANGLTATLVDGLSKRFKPPPLQEDRAGSAIAENGELAAMAVILGGDWLQIGNGAIRLAGCVGRDQLEGRAVALLAAIPCMVFAFVYRIERASAPAIEITAHALAPCPAPVAAPARTFARIRGHGR